jgi:hypothetical protein
MAQYDMVESPMHTMTAVTGAVASIGINSLSALSGTAKMILSWGGSIFNGGDERQLPIPSTTIILPNTFIGFHRL